LHIFFKEWLNLRQRTEDKNTSNIGGSFAVCLESKF
jgi:hypothetical protein